MNTIATMPYRLADNIGGNHTWLIAQKASETEKLVKIDFVDCKC